MRLNRNLVLVAAGLTVALWAGAVRAAKMKVTLLGTGTPTPGPGTTLIANNLLSYMKYNPAFRD